MRQHSVRRRAVFVTLSTIAVGTLGLLAPAAANALPGGVTCYGDYCSGQDPAATGCANDAVTVASADLGAATLDLRWSPTCKTNWARLYVYPTRTDGSGTVFALQQSTGYQQDGSVPAILSWTPQSATDWSPMIYSPDKCVSANFVYDPGYSWNVSSTACD